MTVVDVVNNCMSLWTPSKSQISILTNL